MPSSTSSDAADILMARSQAANTALVQGNFDRYVEIIRPTDDCVLMGPFGGTPLRGYDLSEGGRQRMARQFSKGVFFQQVISTHVAETMAVLATIEEIRGEIGGQAEQEWRLRVTQVFQRQEADWRLVHRHADPLATSVGVARGAALARGEAA